MSTIEQNALSQKTPDMQGVPFNAPEIVPLKPPVFSHENISRNLDSFQPSGDKNKDSEKILQMTGNGEYVDAMRSGQIKMQPGEFLAHLREAKTGSEHADEEHSSDHNHRGEQSEDVHQEKSQYIDDINGRETTLIDKVLKKKEDDGTLAKEIRTESKSQESEQNPEVGKRVERLQQSVDQRYRREIIKTLALHGREQRIFREGMEKFRALQERFPDRLPEAFFSHMEYKQRRCDMGFKDVVTVKDQSKRVMRNSLESLKALDTSMDTVAIAEQIMDEHFKALSEMTGMEEAVERVEEAFQRVPIVNKGLSSRRENERLKASIEKSKKSFKSSESLATYEE